ncbi:S26 family signal peptidase [Natrinema zhouii]|uniref:S26 family signal peptidase n=1 Tax=Natrinema zhouii TaxID=1710539 RepID=A0A7D6H113_9EURY|nr:S26 family signal peptidase [Natrinema zhouii]QLK24567.1 S26 family signal peptidase [Natrinema zhouii]
MDGPDADDRNRDRPGDRDPPSRPERGPQSGTGDRGGTAGSRPRAERDDAVTIEDDGIVRWFLETDDRAGTAIRDVATIIGIIAAVSILLFGISGTWPPLVAVESGSMEPHFERGDLVFVADEERFAGDGAVAGTGIVTFQSARDSGYEQFGSPGDVIIFVPNGNSTQTPTIHRAQFRVERGERWVETKADPAFLNGATCHDIASCPAPHDGFITKGDANPAYDQLAGSGAKTTVVSPEWVTGKAMVRVPWVGQVRLAVDSIGSTVGSGPIVVATIGITIALVWLGAAAGARDP